MENDFRVREINAKDRATFQNERNERDVRKETKFVETTGTKINAESEMESLFGIPSLRNGPLEKL